jgi:hypothetical protein
MRSFEFATPEADHPGSGLQPNRRGTVLVQGNSIYFSDDRSFKQSVHIFALGLSLQEIIPRAGLLSAKFNQARFNGEMHNAPGFALAADIIDVRDEFTEGQASFPAIGFHGLKDKLADRASAMGCSPHAGFDKSGARVTER